MDTETVLEIIKMIDYRTEQTRIQLAQLTSEFVQDNSLMYTDKKNIKHYLTGKLEGYEELSNHLQSFIEGQLNALENQTGE